MIRLLHNIGPKINENYNTPEEILACNDILTFDGVYKNVFDNREILEGKEVILFVTGDYIGKDNSFDKPMPLEKFCNWDELMELIVKYNCKLGWHTWSHRDLTKLTPEEIIYEVTPPIKMDWFAYPYGRYNSVVLDAVSKAGFKQAFSVGSMGNHSNPLALRREYL